MATGYLGTDCATIVGNTGIAPCPYNPKNIGGFMLVPAGTAWTPTQVAALQTTINTGISHNTATSRFFPISKFEDIEDKGTDAVETETGYGVAKFVRNGKYRWRGIYSNGAMDLHTELSKFNGQQDRYDVFIFDNKNNAILGTASGQANIKGFSLDTLYAPNIKVNTGGEDTKYAFEIGLEDESQLNLNWRVITVPTTIPILDTFTGLRPTRLEVVTELVASTKVVVVRVWSGATNLYDTYGSIIAIVGNNLWDSVKNSTGAANVVASVAVSPSTKGFTLTLTDAVTAADEYTINFGTVSDLTTALILKQANATCQTTAT